MTQLIKDLWKMRGGVRPEFNKAESTQQPIRRLAVPPQLIVPLQQHMGQVPNLNVAVGDSVLKGQHLTRINAMQQGAIAHAPSSGVISDIRIFPLPHASGMSGECVFIETDGLDQWIETTEKVCDSNSECTPKQVRKGIDQSDLKQLSKHEILHRVESAGIVGLGGAAFPSAIKLALAKPQQINTLIINAAECEPYISCDDLLIRERASEIIIGIKVLISLLKPKQCLIGIEDNKPEAIAALERAIQEHADGYPIDIKVVATQYPSGDARQLTRILTGIEIPKSQHLQALGVLCHNVATVQAIYHAVVFNRPLLSRIVTITGDGVGKPCNVDALLGTPISYIIEKLGGYTAKAERMIMGGPMMGFALPSDELPIIKASNCILVTSETQLTLANVASASTEKQVMPCIRCNKCADVCPVNLLPQQLYWHTRAHDFEKTTEHNLADCIECGACNYVCPSYIPLVDYFRFAKTAIKSQQQATVKANRSRERFEFNELRKQRNKAEREEKRRQYKAALLKKKTNEAVARSADSSNKASEAQAIDTEKAVKQDAIKAAMERAKAKKAAMTSEKKDSHRDNNSDAV